MKHCNGCGVTRPISFWPKNKSKSDGLGTRCNICTAFYRSVNRARLNGQRRDYYRQNPERYKEDAKKRWVDYVRDRNYGLEPGSILIMLEEQRYVCSNPGCTKEISWTTCHVDHDHKCCSDIPACGTCVRGLLCKGCNWILGHADDNPEVILGLVKYLRVAEEV